MQVLVYQAFALTGLLTLRRGHQGCQTAAAVAGIDLNTNSLVEKIACRPTHTNHTHDITWNSRKDSTTWSNLPYSLSGSVCWGSTQFCVRNSLDRSVSRKHHQFSINYVSIAIWEQWESKEDWFWSTWWPTMLQVNSFITFSLLVFINLH